MLMLLVYVNTIRLLFIDTKKEEMSYTWNLLLAENRRRNKTVQSDELFLLHKLMYSPASVQAK